MVIIGDAAHATSPAAGQEASMAVEDAVTLAKALRDEPDVPDRVIMPLVAARFARRQGHPDAWLFDHHIAWEPTTSTGGLTR